MGLVYIVPMVIGNISISTTFITVGEMLYKVIFSKPQLVKAKLVTKQTVINQVFYIIQLEDGKVKIRFLISYKNIIFFKLDKGININNSLGNI